MEDSEKIEEKIALEISKIEGLGLRFCDCHTIAKAVLKIKDFGLTSRFKNRRCTVKGRNAVFHEWEAYAEVVGESPLLGGHSAGQISCIFGIVEYEDGTVSSVVPHDIVFTDGLAAELLAKGGN